jgi:ADP-ribosylglycohydrolase
VRLQPTTFLEVQPAPLKTGFDFSRLEALLLGLAIGDALANPLAAVSPADRRLRYGDVRHYPSNTQFGGKPAGLPASATQLSFWTLEQLIQDRGLAPDNLAQRFTRERITGIGSSMRSFLREYKDRGQPWYQAGQPSAGSGALVRIAPLLVPHLRRPSAGLWADVVLGGMVTHNDPASHACCLAFTHLLWECLRLESVPQPAWWLDTFLEAARQVEGETRYTYQHSTLHYQGSLSEFIDRQVRQALSENLSVAEACRRWRTGAYLMESLPAVLYILSRHGDHLEEALVRAATDPAASDSIAPLVGAALGAVHGRSAIPTRWIEELPGRVGQAGDWQLFDLIEAARQAFWEPVLPLTRANIQAVLAWLPVIQSPAFQTGSWVADPGKMPYFDYNPETDRLRAAFGQNGFIVVFPWPDWIEGRRFSQDPGLLRYAGLQTLRKLITMHIRADRFNEGHWAGVIESGLLAAILQRMAEIDSSRG